MSASSYTFSSSHIFSELIGTFVIVLIGNAVCSSITFNKMKANNPAKWLLVVFGWSFAVFWGILANKAISSTGPTCLNPAVTFMKMIYMKSPSMFALIPFQFLGAILAQLVIDAAMWRHIVDEKRPLHLLEIHSTFPAYSKSEGGLWSSIMHEAVGTALLCSSVLILSNTNILPSSIQGLIFIDALGVALMVVAILCSWASQTGSALNPARDLGPRLVYRYVLIPLYIRHHRQRSTNSFEINELEERLIKCTNWNHGIVVASLTPTVVCIIIGLIKLASGV